MKKTGIFIALLLLFTASALAQAQNYTVSVRTADLDGANENGTFGISDQFPQAGSKVTITCTPNGNYGVARGAFYAIKNADGSYSETKLADNVSTYREDCANAQEFEFVMPKGNVEVWAYFEPTWVMVVHQAPGGKLEPQYGRREKQPDSLVYNLPLHPIKLIVSPKDKNYELVDVKTVNLHASNISKTADTVTVTMPKIAANKKDTIHVTPVFGKKNYKVTVDANDAPNIKVKLSSEAPKAYEEVEVVLESEKNYIPIDVSITGCQSSWRVGKPQRKDDGGWKTVYRFKVGLQDVTISFKQQQVYAFTVSGTGKSGRIETLVPEMYPGYSGVASKGQEVPVLFQMPDNFSVQYTSSGASAPLVYQNVLENSFADQNMYRWRESNDYNGHGLRMKVDTDSDGNKYWATSVKNSMSQGVALSGRSFPSNANGKLRIAAIASINSRNARTAEVSIVATGDKVSESKIVIADLKNQPDEWQTVFKTAEVNVQADSLKFVVSSYADDLTKTQSHDGPMFDDLCLLLPVKKESIVNEDVLIFTMGNQDVIVNYTSSGRQDVIFVDKKDHATLTLLNTITGEEGDTIHAMEKDVIVIKGQYDEGYAIYDMFYHKVESDGRIKKDALGYLNSDSVDLAGNKIYYHYVHTKSQNLAFIPSVSTLKVDIEDNYGGTITVSNEDAKKGEKVIVTGTPNAGCRLKQLRTSPEGIATFKAENVDAATGAGTYSFEMTSAYITLKPEFVVPIYTAEDFKKIDEEKGEFVLTADLDLGNQWNQGIRLDGYFNGNGHRITYGGTASLFGDVYSHAAVRHLYVTAKVNASDKYVGGIAAMNRGIIEDCEVRGTVRGSLATSLVGGVAGENLVDGGECTISRCHVLCDAIEGGKAFGIASQDPGASIKNNVFNGKFPDNDNEVFMICNDVTGSTIAGNYYVTNRGNSRAIAINGLTAAKTADLVNVMKNTPDDCPVFAASLRVMYDGGYNIHLETVQEKVELINRSSERAPAGTEFSASVRVIGNEHLESITISAADGSNPQNCPFTDNQDNVYFFSFTVPAHDVRVTFKTADGKFIYTPQQFIDISNQNGTFYLAQDIDLNDWSSAIDLNGHFYGRGHTIRYHSEESCQGLFSKIRTGAKLEGLRVVGYVTTTEDCAGIAFKNEGIISDCHFTGRLKKLMVGKSNSKKIVDRVSAIACVMAAGSELKYCSAAAKLESERNQAVINAHPLCFQSDIDLSTCTWVDSTQTDQYSKYRQFAEAARKTYPVYAQGIFEATTSHIIAGHDTIRVESGKTLDELTLTDGEPFRVTGEVKVNRIVYKRTATKGMEQWIFPFAFNRIAGNGKFEYLMTKIEENKLPEIDKDTTKLVLSSTPQTVEYKANSPWLVTVAGGEYVLTNSNGPITLKSTADNHIVRYASLMDRGHIYANYDTIPGKTAQEGLMYVWNVDKQDFLCSDSVDIQPNRFYVQFYNTKYDHFVKYTQTGWSKQLKASSGKSNRSAPQRLAAAMADGWQPIFLDPREPQSVTARILDYYEVAYLTDIYAEEDDKNSNSQRSAVSLVYQLVNERMELPTAIPLLVRAKRADAVPLVTELMGDELDELLLLAALTDDDENVEELMNFDMPHYWCGAGSNRLDIWHLPLSESYADLSEFGCMMFDDTRLEQSFNYAKAADSRSTAPMSYCITVLNTDTFEPLPLIGDRIFVEFVGASEATGISLTPNPSPIGEGNTPMYNLSGQRVGASYKGIILQNGRKYIKR